MPGQEIQQVEHHLISEIRLQPLESKMYLLVTMQGMMTAEDAAARLGISEQESKTLCEGMRSFGAFIDIGAKYEAMHPRFAVVNMYRRMCEREGLQFGRNRTVDNIGVVLERYYESARTK